MANSNPAGFVELDDDTLQDIRGGHGIPYAAAVPEGWGDSTGSSQVSVDCCGPATCVC